MANNVATRLMVFAVPVFCKPKFTVTVSAGSITPLGQPSAIKAKLLETMIGTTGGGADHPGGASLRNKREFIKKNGGHTGRGRGGGFEGGAAVGCPPAGAEVI